MGFMRDEEKNYDELKELALGQGIMLFGVADITEVREDFHLEKETVSKFNRALSLGKRLLDAVVEDIKDRPTPLYYHHYRQVNFFLDRAAFHISCHIEEKGFHALPVAASQTIDWEKQRGYLSHKKVARLAGLGWIGRNNLLVNPRFGARLRLVTVLTDMPLAADSPLVGDCGECRKCIKSCPAEAISERPEEFLHLACFEKLKEFRHSGVVGQYICGICVKACSGNARK